MTGSLEASKARLEQRYKTALLFCVPLIIGFALMFLGSVWGVTLIPGSMVFALILFGFALGAIPAIRYQRARKAYEREKMLKNLTTIAEAFEAKQ